MSEPRSYKLTIVERPTYLHAIVTGSNDMATVMGYLGEVQRECAARGYSRLLIEERLDGPRLGTMAVFHIAAEGSARARGHFDAIAYVDVNAEGGRMKFAETVAVNRALPVKVFSTLADAEKWLLDQGR
jgi:hypothetical protein